MTETTTRAGRWVIQGPYGGRRYSWSQCRYCGIAQTSDCRPADCQLCFTTQCHSNGSGNGCCSVCRYGYLPGWSRTTEQQTCGYKGCENSAVARAPRVGRVCPFHANRVKVRGAGQSLTLFDYAKHQVAERDAGRPEWARWTFLLDEIVAAPPRQQMRSSAMTDETVPTVYAWKIGPFAGGPDEVWFAMCEDGEVMGHHVSSSRVFGPGDVHLTFPERRAVYEAKFGGLGEEFYRFVVLADGEKPPPEVWAANKRWAEDESEEL